MSTGIEWTEDTWNPVVGCTQVSPGCARCYAKVLHDRRYEEKQRGVPHAPQYDHPFEVVQLKPDRLGYPLSWQRGRKIFVNSVSDLFHEDVPEDYIAAVFGVMAAAPRHTFQVLTKRPARMREVMQRLTLGESFLRAALKLGEADFQRWRKTNVSPPWPLPNVWLGVSVENQRFADERIPILLDTPAAVRFLSCEPLLGPVDLTPWLLSLDWVVVGGESGEQARVMRPEWAQSIRDQCFHACVSFFFKQWGGTKNKRGHDKAVLDGARHTSFPVLAHA